MKIPKRIQVTPDLAYEFPRGKRGPMYVVYQGQRIDAGETTWWSIDPTYVVHGSTEGDYAELTADDRS